MRVADEESGVETLQDLRRTLVRAASGYLPSPGRLYRIVPPEGLALLDEGGAECPIASETGVPTGRDAASRAPFSASDEVLPLEPDPGFLWGYWVVDRDQGEAARAALPDLSILVRRLQHAEEMAQLERMNRNLLALFALGESLARVPGPSQMLEALQRTSRQLFGQCHVHLVVLGLEGSICYQVSGPGGPAPSAGSSRDWLRAFPEVSAIWDKSSPQAVNAAKLLGGGTSSGMALRLEDPAVPLGILALTGGDGPFSTEDLSLFCRMGDFTTLALQRWDRAGGGTARSLQRPDLLVLLAQEKERLEYVLRCLPIGLLLTDAEGVIAMANDAAAKALGLTDVELREKKIFGSRQAGRTVRGLIQKSLAEGKTVDTPYEMEGRWFQVEVIPWPGGQQYLLVTQDIHDWFQLNRLKEDLISIISHEVKNPLTAVLNAAHLLSSGRAGTLNEAQTRISVLVQENSQQIKRLLDDVVRLSRVYHLNVKTEPVALAPMVRAVHTRSAATMRGKLITWTESLEELTVRGETPMLDSLLVNLIGNAVKYTGIGGHVGVRLWSDGSRAMLRVMDDGPGIPADERSRLFSPFFRASNVRDQVTGTGLGLVISRNIAERLGGSLTAVSPITPEDASFLGHVRAAAKGTAFQVELPLAP